MNDEMAAKWLRAVELDTSGPRLAAVTAAATQYPDSADVKSVVALTELAAGLESDPGFHAVSTAVRAGDATFACGPKDLETRLIAAIMLAALMETDSNNATMACQTILSADWRGDSLAHAELSDLASQHLVRRSEAQRGRPKIASGFDGKAGSALVNKIAEDDGAATHTELRAIASALQTVSSNLTRGLPRLEAQLSERLKSNEEELDLLWWAFSGNSADSGEAWDDIEDSGRLVTRLAFEFERLTVWYSEPRSTHQILRRLLKGRTAESISLADLASAAPTDLELPLAQQCSLLPVLSCIHEHREFNGDDAWKASVRRWHVDALHTSSALETCLQLIREILIAGRLAE
jgi:hypothetical protein